MELRPLLWARFRDDIYLPWTHSEEKLYELLEFLNTRLPGIKFTVEHSSDGIAFLDTFIYSRNGKIHTRIYSKECDNHHFLIPTSCHPIHIFRNIPFNIAQRIYKITSEATEYAKSKQQYSDYLLERGYREEIIKESFQKIEEKERTSLYNTRKDTKKESKRCFPLICDFNPGLPNIRAILNKHKQILDLDECSKKVIDKDNVFASYRGTKTLKDILTHSKLKKEDVHQESTHEGESKKCDKQCYVCKHYLVEASETDNYHTNTIHTIVGKSTCGTKSVVYMIQDNICKINYIGCTSDSVKVRFSNHKSHIKKRLKTCELSEHFTENQHIHVLDTSSNKKYDECLAKQISIIILEKVDIPSTIDNNAERLKFCKVKERQWQHKVKTYKDYGGLNIREEKKTLI